jgi:hypothetical protein
MLTSGAWRYSAVDISACSASTLSPARVMGPLVCHELGTGLFRFQAVC